MNVVLYLRYSSDNQTEQSIEGQRRVCEEFCRKNHYFIDREYIDRATSAFKETTKRTNFLQMIEDAKKKEFDAVVVYKLDRFARSRTDSAIFKSQLKKYGVKVISATENISDNPEGIILESVLEGMAEFYSMELSQKVKRGLKESILKGKVSVANLPLGYDQDENMHYVINEKEAVIVRRVFNDYLNGKTFPTIARELNREGYRQKNGAEFKDTSFYYLIKNERYIGRITFEGEVYEGFIPPIIDMSTWNAIQDKMDSKRRNKVKKSDYLLSAKVFCSKCGCNMPGTTSTIKGHQYSFYRCKTKSCGYVAIKKELVEDLVFNTIQEEFNDENIERIADEIIKINDENIGNALDPRIAIENEIKDYDKKIKNIAKVIEDGMATKTLVARLDELEELKEKAELRLRNSQFKVQPKLTKEQLIFYIETRLKLDKEQMIKFFINKVIYNKDTKSLEIQYFLNDGNDLVLTRDYTSLNYVAPNSLKYEKTPLQVLYLK